ncbi:sensor histidine kinase [Chitinophaga sp.]|uniref:sensor histidine kinase n=1 Tax=Chitinophaga sp. TaxID=1869181 RepID=UPI002C1BD861|nr:sensor histidine kinase [Chitinophaga sp.]HWV70037.1 sensor histidine kinase [Chitinophaga sp.]
MKKNISVKKITIALHILIWGVILLLPYIVSNASGGYRMGSLPGLFFSISGIIHMGIFYIHAFVLYPRLWNRRYWWLYFPAVIALIGLSFPLKYTIMAHWFPEVVHDVAAYKFVFGPSVGIYFISLIYCRVADMLRAERRQKEQQAEQLSSELKFLRSQVSPHFLFNVLTNLVSLARKKSDQLEPALIRLSDLMRYMLYDTGKKVLLSQEILYLNSYIALQQLRFGNEVAVNVQMAGSETAGNYTIEPMLLIPFVENAFKHGTGYTPHPAIDIQLAVKEDVLIFEVTNEYDSDPNASKDENSGIGLMNVQTRLQLLYPGRHQLLIRDEPPLFHIALTLTLT